MCGQKPVYDYSSKSGEESSSTLAPSDYGCRENANPETPDMVAVTNTITMESMVSFERPAVTMPDKVDLNIALQSYLKELSHGNNAMAEIEAIITLREMGVNSDVARQLASEMSNGKLLIDQRIGKIILKMAGNLPE